MIESTIDPASEGPPRLSVVIASSNEGVLDRCIRALALQATPDVVELIVVRAADRSAGFDRQQWMAQSPSLQWIEAPARSTVPRLKAIGIAAARAERIAVIEDDCIVAADWCRHAMSAPQSSAALGGAVEPGPYRGALDWAVYFCEYGRFMLPVPSSASAPLPGNNVVYSRWAITALPAGLKRELWDAFVHAAWQRDAVPTSVSGSLVVQNVNTWSSSDLTSVPFHHGRAYAAQRFSARGPAVRAGFALLVAGLPLLKIARIVFGTVTRHRLVGRTVQALPWMLIFVVSWSAGELVGCLFGPGSSPSRWR